jgi:hypothetical protein
MADSLESIFLLARIRIQNHRNFEHLPYAQKQF